MGGQNKPPGVGPGTPGRARQAELVVIVLWVPTQFPNRKQYPLSFSLKRETQEGLQSLINSLLVVYWSPPILHVTLILPVKKKDRTWWMVQDLQIINEAVVPLLPMISNPYVILGEIPPSAKWFTVLNLKDTFFYIPLVKESQYLWSEVRGSRRKTTNDLDSITSGIQR